MLRTAAPPYALAATGFRFPALAALAGRLPLGAGREVALAGLLAARLAAGALPASPLSRPVRAQRATAAIQWLGATCPDAKVRAACTAVADASATDDVEQSVRALSRLIEVIGPHMSGEARAELNGLAKAFTEGARAS